MKEIEDFVCIFEASKVVIKLWVLKSLSLKSKYH